jgi:F-type H+-transporting ATPase subunit b
MPQLQPGDFAPQLIWLAIIFTLFYLALSRLALPRIESVIAARKAKIEGDLKGAREAQTLADREAERYEAEIAAAKAKGQGSIRAAREKLDVELGGKRETLDRQLAAKAAETEKRVQDLLQRAAGEMESMTAGVVGDIVKAFAGVEVSEGEVRTALRQGSKE